MDKRNSGSSWLSSGTVGFLIALIGLVVLLGVFGAEVLAGFDTVDQKVRSVASSLPLVWPVLKAVTGLLHSRALTVLK
ncbi:MAG: hypothetical protein N3G20_09680, partial [Verrucomicrobiae bacterium]|nr:hypothetical protein [Verrucomicrobiae bacterium]